MLFFLPQAYARFLTDGTLQSLLLEKVKNGLDLPKDASNREEVFQEIKDKTTAWVAKYRRGAQFQGRPSYRSGLAAAASCVINNFLAIGSMCIQLPVPHVTGCSTANTCNSHNKHLGVVMLQHHLLSSQRTGRALQQLWVDSPCA